VKTCPICGKKFEPVHRAKVYCCRKCRDKSSNSKHLYRLYDRTIETRTKPVKVTYPGVALPDFYTRSDYAKYKDDLPEGAVVEMI